MSAMEIKCPRCGSTWRVSEEKAGKRGRCPQCWGIIKVPDKAHDPAAEAHHYTAPPTSPARKVFFIAAGVVLLAGIVLTVVLRKGAEMDSGGGVQELTPEVLTQLRVLNMELNQLERISDQCDQLDNIAREERCLRARDVLRKDKAYEPVSAVEYSLRAAVKDEEMAYRAECEKKAQSAPPSWQLDVPLQEDERALLTQKSTDVVKSSEEITQALAQTGLKASTRQDLVGRNIVNTDEARKLLDAKLEKLHKTIADVRSGAAQKGTQ